MRLVSYLPAIVILPLVGNSGSTLRAQGTGGPVVADTRVGYIDGAIPADQLRFRFDAGFDNRRATRAEFFYPQNSPGRGLPLPESSIDHQDVTLLGEKRISDRFSVFGELPFRLIDPAVNSNAGGVSDLSVGWKWAFARTCDTVATLQTKWWIPTGDGRRGLGTEHASIEPGFLFHRRLAPRWGVEGELKCWIPLGGGDFAGEIIRYGLGTHFDWYRSERVRAAPVVELVGWQVLSGQENVFVAPGLGTSVEAAGDAILNLKMGMRLGLGSHSDIYFGYGRALTGDQWYADIFRFEFRLFR